MPNAKKLMTSSQNNKLSMRDRMMAGDVELISNNLTSDNNLGIVLAIGALVKNKIRTPLTDSTLLRLRNNSEREFCMSISDLAYAALDILGIEKYMGSNNQVNEIIKSNFNFVD